MTPTSIETMSGRFVDLVNPDHETITLRDIAWATSRMPRYVGHTISPIPYTIGQHSIFVTQLVIQLFKKDCIANLRQSFYDFVNERYKDQPELRETVFGMLKRGAPHADLLLELLMHDASEAYIVDVPTPLKEADGFRQVYLEHEMRMMSCIRTAFNMRNVIDGRHEVFLKWADRAALTIETYHLIASRGKNWTRLMPLDMTSMQLFETPKAPIEVYEDFVNWFEELTMHP